MSVPALRFTEFSGDWKDVPFGDIYSFKTTNSYSRECLNYLSGSAKNIHYGDIHTKFKSRFNINNEHVPFVNENVNLSKINPECFCEEGDLVIADASEDYKDIGKSIEIDNLGNQSVLAGLHTFLARPKSGILSRGFMSHAMQSMGIRLQIMTIAQGAKVLSISTGRLSKVNVPLPVKEEQNKIANCLTAVDEKITQLSQKYNLLSQYKKGVMQQIFSQELRFKDDDGQDFPEWEDATLGEIGKFKSGTGFSDTEQGGTSGIPFYKVSDMNLVENKLEMLVANNYVSEDQIKKMKYKVISDEAIVFAKVGAAIFLERKRKAKNFLIDNNMMAFIPECQINFIKHFMDSIRLSKFAQVGALPSYNASDLSIIEIALPCIQEQTKVANFLTAIDEKITNTQTQLQALKQYKKGLLQQMFV